MPCLKNHATFFFLFKVVVLLFLYVVVEPVDHYTKSELLVSMALKKLSVAYCVVHYTYYHMPCLVAVVDCTHVGSGSASFHD